MATYAKLKDGSWGLKGSNLVEGASVTVTKKSGETKSERVGKVLFRGADGTCFARIEGASRGGSSRPSSGRRFGGGRCRGCGGAVVNAPHHRAMEGYCGSCAFDEFDC